MSSLFLKKQGGKGASFHKIWRRLLMVAVLSIVLPILVLGALFYSSWRASQNENFSRRTLNRLKNVSLTIQQNFNMIDNDLLMMKTSSDFYDFKKMMAPGEHVRELQDVSNRLAEICTKYAFVQSVYFYDSRYQVFVTNTYGTYSYERFYDREWLDALDSSYQVIRLPVRVNVDQEILKDEKRMRTLMYRPEDVITIAGSGINSIRLAINISAAGLYQYLDGIYTFDDCGFFVVSGEGKIVLSADASRVGQPFGVDLSAQQDGVLRAGDELLFVNPMENNQLICVMSFPQDVNDAPYAYFKSYIFILCLLVTGVVVVISSLLTRQIYSPVTDLVQTIKDLSLSGRERDETGIRDDITYIKGLYGELENDRQAMEATRLVYGRVLRAATFRNYLEGLIPYDRMREQMSAHFDPQAYHCRFVAFSIPCALLCRDGGDPEVNLTEILDTYINNAGRGLFLSMEKNIFLALLAQDEERELDAVAQMIHRLLDEILEGAVFAGQCGVADAREDLIPSYQRALEACRQAAFFESPGVMDAGEAPLKFDYSFVVNAEATLIRSVLSYRRDETAACLRWVGEEVRRTPDYHYVRSVYLRLLTTLVKELGLNTLFDHNLFERYYRLETLREIESYLSGLLLDATALLENGGETRNLYCAQAKAFLKENYARDLSVGDIADQLGISYPYLSKLFKDDTNMGLLDYLNQIRVEKSKEYLLNTCDNLNVVAEKVGYRNCQSYQRFFKKLVGVTPGEYRRVQGRM